MSSVIVGLDGHSGGVTSITTHPVELVTESPARLVAVAAKHALALCWIPLQVAVASHGRDLADPIAQTIPGVESAAASAQATSTPAL